MNDFLGVIFEIATFKSKISRKIQKSQQVFALKQRNVQ